MPRAFSQVFSWFVRRPQFQVFQTPSPDEMGFYDARAASASIDLFRGDHTIAPCLEDAHEGLRARRVCACAPEAHGEV